MVYVTVVRIAKAIFAFVSSLNSVTNSFIFIPTIVLRKKKYPNGKIEQLVNAGSALRIQTTEIDV